MDRPRCIAQGIVRATAADAYRPISMKTHQRRFIGHGDRKAPSLALWVAMASEEAHKAGLAPSMVLGPSRKSKAVWARWRAWERILDHDLRYSFAGVARTTGWDHTTILAAMKRLQGFTAHQIKQMGERVASGRYPSV